TSMATPHVSGAALILNQYAKLQGNTLTPHEVKVALNSTGKLIDDTANSGKSYSRIDVYSAISSLNTAPNITSFYPLSSQNIIEPQNQTFNITYTDLNNDDITIVWYKNGTAVGSSAEYNFTGNFFTSGSYNITVIITDGINSTHHSWNLTVNNTNRLPTVQSLLSSSDPGNRTNGTLTADWITSDPDTDDSYLNQTRWYNNSIEQIQLENMTELNSANTSKNQLWTVSVRTFDGTIWSNWSNASLQIKNSIPVVQHLQDITVLEKARINISVNATDEDNDQLIYMINDSRFTQNIENFTWTPNLTQSGTYIVSINVSDGEVVQWQNITITVLNAPDFDNDGNPDYNDTDDDNDNILDGQDTLDGNSSTINSTVSIILLINDSTNITRGLNNTQRVNLTDQRNNSIISFDWNFTRSRLTLNFTINYNASAGTIIINKLDLTGQQKTKTVYINKSSAAYNYICIADYEVQSITEITADCTGANEKKVPCTGTLGQYTCTDLGTIFKVTGLNHSAVKGITVTTSTGGTGGGGGGGGSSTTTAIAVKEPCVEDWTCNPWSECIDGKTKRACADINRCKTELDKPETEKTCTPEPVLVQIPEIKEQPQPAQETVTQPQQPVELSAPFNFTPILIMTLLLISAASIILLFPKIRSKITDKKLHHHINKYLENHSEKEIYSKLMKTGWGREIIKKKNPK
ncbi:MAG: hypothetical protein KJ601_07525, partial [Nanoarchaeota archaeon]|nr:hypothetical protein [Nanoarchaeota archaeon]